MRKKYGFDDGDDGFLYEDDLFRLTDEPGHARGRHLPSGGRDEGGLSVTLGGRDDDAVRGMSGGWTKVFRLDEPENVTLTFRYKVLQDADYGARQYVDVLASIDGELVGRGDKPYVARFSGDGRGGDERETGWRTVTIELGELDAGRHEISLGGFGNKKTGNVKTKIFFDDVSIEGDAPPARPVKLGRFEAEVLELTNAYREKHGRDPLTADANLTAAAEDWSREMARGDFFKHSEKPDQLVEHGYDARGYGENIAAGQPTPEEVVEAWIDSPGHRKNLLRADFEHIGIGYYKLSDDDGDVNYGRYWTQIFGDPSNDYLG